MSVTRTWPRGPGVVAWLIMGLSPVAASGDERPDEAVDTTPHFAFYSDFATNLNDALVAAGIARKFEREELFQSGAEAQCLAEMPPSALAGWNLAVDFYQQFISPAGFNDRPQYQLRLYLAGYGDAAHDPGMAQFIRITQGLMDAATPAYQACRWRTQDRQNRQWIEHATELLAMHEPRVSAELEKLYQKPWQGLPIRIDVVETVSWSGANSVILEQGGGHLLVSHSYQGNSALEIVFHEASHLLMDRDAPLQKALADAAKAQAMEPPDGLWHVILFYTTGETVRQSLSDAGETYEPMLQEIYTRSPWGQYQDSVNHTWPAYLQATKPLAEVAEDLLQAIKAGGQAN